MDFREENGTSMTGYDAKKMKLINSRLKKINKPFVKSIKSPRDIIDCVLFHLQPSLNHPGLKEKLTLSPRDIIDCVLFHLQPSLNHPGLKEKLTLSPRDIIDCVLFHLQPSLNHPGLKEKLTLSPRDIIDCVLFHLQPSLNHPGLKEKLTLSPRDIIDCVLFHLQPSLNHPGLKEKLTLSPRDIIDCVLFHLQPSLNHPGLKEKLTLILPELPKGHDNEGSPEIKQLWNSKGESCPNGTIPIRRTSASDIYRSISSSKSRKKYSGKDIPIYSNHEHALGYVNKGEFYGTKALLNVWEPNVTQYDFSLSQIWVLTDIPDVPANSVEAGWYVTPNNYIDSLPRLFTYWTPDGYKSGCYNTECPGFVQTSQKYCLGAVIDPISTYNGQQYDVTFMILKDIKSGNWWLRVAGELIGFWPKELFTNLQAHATSIQYGGEVFSHDISSRHTSTQMGSGHFPDEGFGKAAYIRSLEVVDQNNYLNVVTNLNLFPEKPNCYSVTSGYSDVWGNYVYFGGPGYSPTCL